MLKNNKLNEDNTTKLCKTHNDKKRTKGKIKLCVVRSHMSVKTYHPLKNKKVKLSKLTFTDETQLGAPLRRRDNIDSKRWRVNCGSVSKKWSTELEVCDYLKESGVPVRRTALGSYMIYGKEYSLGKLLVLANKKRKQLGLELFYIEDLTED